MGRPAWRRDNSVSQINQPTTYKKEDDGQLQILFAATHTTMPDLIFLPRVLMLGRVYCPNVRVHSNVRAHSLTQS